LGKSTKSIAKSPLAISCFFGLSFEPEMLETQSRALKTRIMD